MSRRLPMLATSVRKLIAPVLRECPQECGIVTITEVEVSRDLSSVTVSISALRSIAVAMTFLESRRKELQRLLSSLHTHRTPLIRFRSDTRAEQGSRIEQLLERASGGSTEGPCGTSSP